MLDRDKLNQLYRYAIALSANDQIAWDLVQDSVEKVIHKPFVFNKMAYAKKCIRNQFYDVLKSKFNSAHADLDEESLTSSDDPESKVDQTLSVEQLLEMISPEEREILFLWAVEEYTTEEVAQELSMPKGTVTSKIKRLRDRLVSNPGSSS
jgi:RNA polymerase sigma-70 factor (ECF subfamily)